MIMYLNNNEQNPIEIKSYSRNLAVGDPNVLYRIEINFGDDISAEGVEAIASNSNNIESIKVVKDETVMLNIFHRTIRLEIFNDSCDEYGRYVHATYVVCP